ncbi:hypothetical protein HZS_5399 [Henneguya salminicola]|nr:hypothetical protein HZS_5399 [Henneguya salminicola]
MLARHSNCKILFNRTGDLFLAILLKLNSLILVRTDIRVLDKITKVNCSHFIFSKINIGMNYNPDVIRRACFELENALIDSSHDKPISSYSNKLRESCRKYSDKYPFKIIDNGSSLIFYDLDVSQLSHAKRHKKFVLAKLELKNLQEKSKDSLKKIDDIDNKFKRIDVKKYKSVSILKKNNKLSNKKIKTVKFSPEPLFWDCALDGDLESLQKISLKMKNIDEANFSGVTALHNAASSGSLICVQFLNDLGCNVNATDDCGWTPLHYAAYYGNLNICDYLIKNGANVFLQTFDEKFTPYDICKHSQPNKTCCKFLEDSEKSVGLVNEGIVYTSHHYEKLYQDELSFRRGEKLHILRRGDKEEKYWWWARSSSGREGYAPFSLLTVI